MPWLLAAIATAACADSTTPEPFGGETHFLHACDGSDSCGLGLDCICGVCTEPCLTDNSCKDHNALATCESAGTPNGACDNPLSSPVCDVHCDANTDCNALGTGYSCESGSCRKLADGSCLAGGVIYADGAQYSLDECNSCLCNNGTFNCTDIACTDGGMDAAFDSGDGSAARDSGMDATASLGPTGVFAVPVLMCGPLDQDAGAELEALPIDDFGCSDQITSPPGAQILASTTGGTFALTESDVVWMELYLLGRVSKIGGTPMRIPGAPSDGSALALDGCRAYVGLYGGGIDVASIDTGEHLHHVLFPDVVAVGALAVDSESAFAWMDTTLVRVPKVGGEVIAVATSTDEPNGPWDPRSLVVTATHLYWHDNDEDRQTARDILVGIPKDGSGPPTVIADQLANPLFVIESEGALYVMNRGTEDALRNHRGDGSVLRIDIATGALTTLTSNLTLAQISSDDIVADAQYLYWAAERSLGRRDIMRLSKSNPQTPSVVFADVSASQVLVDSTHLYWNASCSGPERSGAYIVRAPKP